MAYVERWLKEDHTGGTNLGLTRSDPFESPGDAFAAVDVLLAAGDSVILRCENPASIGSHIGGISHTFATTETAKLIIIGFDQNPDDGGVCRIGVAAGSKFHFSGSGVTVIGLAIYGDINSYIFTCSGDGNALISCEAHNSTASGSYTGFDISDGSIALCKYRGFGTGLRANRCQILYNDFKISSSTRMGIFVRGGYRSNTIHGNLIVKETPDKVNAVAGIQFESSNQTSPFTCSFNTVYGFYYGIHIPDLRTAVTTNYLITGNLITGAVIGIINVAKATSNVGLRMYRNAFYDCDTEADVGISVNLFNITVTADPFIDAANDNFNLNDNVSGGALVKGKYPFSAGRYGDVLSLGACQG